MINRRNILGVKGDITVERSYEHTNASKLGLEINVPLPLYEIRLQGSEASCGEGMSVSSDDESCPAASHGLSVPTNWLNPAIVNVECKGIGIKLLREE